MTNLKLVFIPSPGAGHLPPMVELAKILLHRDQRLSVTIIVMKINLGAKHDFVITTDTPRLQFIDIAFDECTMALLSPHTFLLDLVEHHKRRVRDIARSITESDSSQLAGFIVNMFCLAMADVADEFGAPTYINFPSSAAMLGLMLTLQAKRDQDGHDVTELKDSESEICIPSYVNLVPAKLLPEIVFDKEGGAKMFLDLAKRFRQSKGIIVNTFQELDSHGVHHLLSSNDVDIPPLFPVGPILNLMNTSKEGKTEDIMNWLSDQPESSVVFLCFGSMGSFSKKQIKEIAVAVELSGHRFLWSLRRQPPKGKIEYPKEYENPEEVLPEGFLERTSSVGKVIGWAPQTAVLSHPSVGGFVSHCGWNSTLESIWFGVPIAAWPLYAEQQLNAFQLVVELGLAVGIRIDYRSDMSQSGSEMIVTAEEIEGGIRRLMSDGELRKKVKEMKPKSSFAVSEGGSSYSSIGRFIQHVFSE